MHIVRIILEIMYLPVMLLPQKGFSEHKVFINSREKGKSVTLNTK